MFLDHFLFLKFFTQFSKICLSKFSFKIVQKTGENFWKPGQTRESKDKIFALNHSKKKIRKRYKAIARKWGSLDTLVSKKVGWVPPR